MIERAEHGQVLIELLISLAVAAVILSLGAQLIYVTLQASKISGRKNVATSLLEEMFAGMQGTARAQWQNLYGLTKNSDYHMTTSSGTWAFATTVETVTVDGIAYTRSFKVQNVCRSTGGVITGITDSTGTATGASACTGSGGNFDPSTELVVAVVSWPDNQSVMTNRYIERWGNKVCTQTAWSATGSGVLTCPDTHYGSSTNLTTGTTLQICPSGC